VLATYRLVFEITPEIYDEVIAENISVYVTSHAPVLSLARSWCCHIWRHWPANEMMRQSPAALVVVWLWSVHWYSALSPQARMTAFAPKAFEIIRRIKRIDVDTLLVRMPMPHID